MDIPWISDPQGEGWTMGAYFKYVLEGRGPQRGVMDLESKPGGGVDERDSWTVTLITSRLQNS
jgi:hypothetical protein